MRENEKGRVYIGFLASVWSLFALWVRSMTLADVGPSMRPFYDAAEWMYSFPAMWFLLSAALAGVVIVRLFRGQCGTGTEKTAALLLTLLACASVPGWAILSALA